MRVAVLIKVEHKSHDAAELGNKNFERLQWLCRKTCLKTLKVKLLTSAAASGSAVFLQSLLSHQRNRFACLRSSMGSYP